MSIYFNYTAKLRINTTRCNVSHSFVCPKSCFSLPLYPNRKTVQTMRLPDDFISEMQGLLDDNSMKEFLYALTQTPPTSIRLNTRRITGEAMKELTDTLHLSESNRIPWCENGYYLDRRPQFIMDPLFHAGAYYVQEASSMYISFLLRHYIGTRNVSALDLCAAPGGKSTLLLSELSEDSTLVANEIIPKRASILCENICKWDSNNVTVTNNRPEDFSRMKEVFDLILCDVPCSGEGMFRKDPDSISQWSPHNVDMCSKRQRDIVSAIWDCLKPGGLMIYSTCTYNTKENEENVRWISLNLGAEILSCPTHSEWDITQNLIHGEAFDCLHFMPHKQKGEGFFCAILKKEGEYDGPHGLSIHNRKVSRLNIQTLEDRTTGSVARVDVDKQTALRYLKGEALILPPDTPKGLVTITYMQMPLGKMKNIGSRANNLYPKEWRIRKQLSQ